MSNIATVPWHSEWVYPDRRLTKEAGNWLQEGVIARAQQSAQTLLSVPLTAQNASIGTTAIPTGALESGTYRVNYYAAITTAASVSSSLIVTFSWTDGGVSKTYVGAAMTGNTTATVQSASFLINIDASSAVSYATTYASNGAGEMVYKLTVFLEFLG